MKIAQAVARRAGVALSEDSLLRVAALGTIADLVPLQGENRAIAARGLAALATSRAPGLRALLAESGLAPGAAPTAEEVAFRIAPRLNAAGRIDTGAPRPGPLRRAGRRAGRRDRPRALDAQRRAAAARTAGRGLGARPRRGGRRRLRRASSSRRIPAGIGASWASPLRGWRGNITAPFCSSESMETGRADRGAASRGSRCTECSKISPATSRTSAATTRPSARACARAASRPFARRPAITSRPACRPRLSSASRRPRRELPLDEVSDELLAELARLEPHGAANPRPVFLARDATATGPFSPARVERPLRAAPRRAPRLEVRRLAAGAGAFAAGVRPHADGSSVPRRGRPERLPPRGRGPRRPAQTESPP